MIIWLASYPRSGNTLLRMVLKQTMDMGSYSNEIMPPNIRLSDPTNQSIGLLSFAGSWDSFYHQASNAEEIFLVKTHQPPCDNQPAIYVIRDGRAATESYAAYHASFAPDPNFCPSILDLILGNDFYGDWTTHYRMWSSRIEANFFLVRFEELINADRPLLEKLGSFVGFSGQIINFENPFQKLQNEDPDFFRIGRREWETSLQWTEESEAVFMSLHGELLSELGYPGFSKPAMAKIKLSPACLRLIKLANQGFKERNSWHYEARLKEKVIQELLLKNA